MKIGLVLPGGGGKGAYQIGVMKALDKLGIKKHIKYVSGSSIGSLNSLLFMQGDLDIAQEVWENISSEKILPVDNFELIKKGFFLSLGSKNLNFVRKYIPGALAQGNLSRDGLMEIADKYLNVEKIKECNIISYASCADIETLNPKYFRYNGADEERIKKIFLATSAIPSIYEPEKIDGKLYVDGGIADNIPIQPLYGEGCEIIIIAHLNKEFTINKEDYPNTKIIEIFPSYMEDGIVKGLLNFSSDTLKRRIQRGYDDTINILEPIIELALFCNIGVSKDNKIVKFIKNII
ncbi:MAG: patatin-like phospholipase family protein [Sarcina sp.]